MANKKNNKLPQRSKSTKTKKPRASEANEPLETSGPIDADSDPYIGPIEFDQLEAAADQISKHLRKAAEVTYRERCCAGSVLSRLRAKDAPGDSAIKWLADRLGCKPEQLYFLCLLADTERVLSNERLIRVTEHDLFPLCERHFAVGELDGDPLEVNEIIPTSWPCDQREDLHRHDEPTDEHQ